MERREGHHVIPDWISRSGGADCDCVVRLPAASSPAGAPALAAIPVPPQAARPAPSRPRRRRSWELDDSLHCSIIGTCLTAHELRRLLRKLGLGADDATDHELHGIAVALAGRQDGGAKLLNKLLDERHRLAIRRFDAAEDAAALLRLWHAAAEAGEIPGAYWATLTHPAAEKPVVRVVFGEVHMLSHLVGAANRADIRRLAAQEREIAALREALAERHGRSRAALAERDRRIAALEASAAQAVAPPPPAETSAPPDPAAGLRERLAAAELRCATLEARAAAAEAAAAAARQREAEAREEAEALAREAATLEAAFAVAAEPEAPPPAPPRTVLYVGGRPGQLPALRQGAARLGATLLHHDGAPEGDGAAPLAALVARADLVAFPVDCVSHDAALAVKRHCGRLGRRFLPLRSSGVSSFLAALAATGAPAEA